MSEPDRSSDEATVGAPAGARKDRHAEETRPGVLAELCGRGHRAPGANLTRRGEVAQLVEHTTENRGVGGSIPPLAIA